jgi:hypothetical protein
MQETHFSQNVLNQLMQDFEGSLYQSHGTSNLKGWLFG